MANLTNFGSFYPRRLSEYVPAMQYSADLQLQSNNRLSFGAPLSGQLTFFLNGQSVASAGSLQAAGLLNNATTDTPFGRALAIALSGAGTGTVIVDGYDYLNQPISESLAMNGASTVNGVKAFKYIRQVTWTAVAATTLNLGILSSRLGLPYKAIKAYTEEVNGVPGTVGTLISPDLTFPATLTTGDPRGLFSPAGTLNGTNIITATFDFCNDVDANNNGGLMGVPHYTN